MTRARAAALIVTMLGVLFLAVADGNSTQGSCLQAQPASIPGHPEYLVATCCSKGCGGKCCRCGSATGWKPGCTVKCSVATTDDDAETVSLAPQIIVWGRLVHVRTGRPLADEKVSLKVPGGRTFEVRTADDGTFVLSLGGADAIVVNVGDHPSVTKAERDRDEDDRYQLFLTRKKPLDIASAYPQT